MMMEPFYSKFPEIAEKEGRCIIIPTGKKLPAGEYFIAESFCNENSCDCRRAFINIFHKDKIIATIGYGWESVSFYEEWIGEKSLAKEVKGPILEMGGLQSEHSAELLKLFKEVMLNDFIFIDRLKKHYQLFKSTQKNKLGRNDPCSCGSGIKYKKCCMK